MQYIKEHICEHFGRDIKDPKALKGLRFLDIGCGGGLLCEAMAHMGATIIAADAREVNIKVAKTHAAQSILKSTTVHHHHRSSPLNHLRSWTRNWRKN